jgi:hypothetical protein
MIFQIGHIDAVGPWGSTTAARSALEVGGVHIILDGIDVDAMRRHPARQYRHAS